MKKNNISIVLSIAGSDSSAGAGIQADIKTIQNNQCYATTVISAITAQNTQGISLIESVSSKMLEEQINQICEDFSVKAVKIGMIYSIENLKIIIKKLKEFQLENIVLDTVMGASSDDSNLFDADGLQLLKEELIPLVTVLTPNIKEAEVLTNIKINSFLDAQKAIMELKKLKAKFIVLKGGHIEYEKNKSIDILYDGKKSISFTSKRVKNPNHHGSGCTFSSAIACNLAKGYSIVKSVKQAKKYVIKAIEKGYNLGHGVGPIGG